MDQRKKLELTPVEQEAEARDATIMAVARAMNTEPTESFAEMFPSAVQVPELIYWAGWRVVVAFLSACVPGCAAKPPDPTDVEAVEIRLDQWREQKAAKVSSTDAAKFEALLALLRSAEPTRDHKCGDSGQITLRRKDGSDVKIGILAGHNRRYYEFRVYRGSSYDIFRVERVPFLKEIEAFGVGGLDPGSPE